jgi:hypothetical protein
MKLAGQITFFFLFFWSFIICSLTLFSVGILMFRTSIEFVKHIATAIRKQTRELLPQKKVKICNHI